MIKRIKISKRDSKMISPSSILVISKCNDCSNYEGLVVKKPWGFEYLLFHNNYVAGWILHINQKNQTSLHCHPNKKTSLIVLKGEGIFSTSKDARAIKEGECFMIDKGVFHSTKAISDMIVLEIETPPNKKDLHRLDDAYGRALRDYEGAESHINLSHKDYANIATLYNFKENFGSEIDIGNYSLSIHKHKKIKGVDENKFDLKNTIIVILGEGFSNGEKNIEPADIVYGHNFKKITAENINSNNEILLIIKK